MTQSCKHPQPGASALQEPPFLPPGALLCLEVYIPHLKSHGLLGGDSERREERTLRSQTFYPALVVASQQLGSHRITLRSGSCHCIPAPTDSTGQAVNTFLPILFQFIPKYHFCHVTSLPKHLPWVSLSIIIKKKKSSIQGFLQFAPFIPQYLFLFGILKFTLLSYLQVAITA